MPDLSLTAYLSYPLGVKKRATLMEGPVTHALKSAEVRIVTMAQLGPMPSIFDEVLRSVAAADLIIAEVTDQSPSVYYELGLANAVGKAAIVLSERPDEISPHLGHYPAVVYSSAGTIPGDVERRLLDALDRFRHPAPTPTELILASPDSHLLVEVPGGDLSSATDLAVSVVALVRGVGATVVLDRVRTGSFFGWLKVGATAARWGRKIQERFSTKDFRDAQAEQARAAAERDRAEAAAVTRKADRDDALAAIEIYERLAALASNAAAGPFSVTIGGETRVEADGHGNVRVVPPTPEQLGAPPDLRQLPRPE